MLVVAIIFSLPIVLLFVAIGLTFFTNHRRKKKIKLFNEIVNKLIKDYKNGKDQKDGNKQTKAN